MKQILIILGLFASVTTFAQSPRIKLNQITKDTVKGSVLISNPTDSGMVYSRDFFIAYGLTDTVLILYGDTLAATSGIISSVLSDGVTITGDGTTGNELKADTSVIATIKALNDSLATVSASTTPDGVTITGDGSVGNPLKVDTLLISTIQGLVDTLTARGYLETTQLTDTLDTNTRGFLTAEVDGSITNELQTISTSGLAGNITLSDGGGTLNLNVDDADASATNEGSLTVAAGGANDSEIQSNTSGSSNVVIAGGSNVTVTESGQTITIASTGGGTTYNNISETADTVFIDKFLNVDTSTLYVDATNNTVGIGSQSTTENLKVDGDVDLGNGILYVDTTANRVAIGHKSTNYDFYKLDVRDTVGLDLAVSSFGTATNGGSALIMQTADNEAFTNGKYILLAQYHSSHTGSNIYGRTRAGLSLINAYKPSSMIIGHNANADLGFVTSSTERMTIKGNGDLKLDPSTSGAGAGVTMSWNSSDSTIYFSASSIRFKDNISDYDKGISDLMQMKPVYFNYKTSPQLEAGFIAEDIESIGLDEYITKDGEGLVFGLRVGAFKPLIVKAIQEQQAIIETQQTEIDQLKTLITDLTNRLIILENK